MMLREVIAILKELEEAHGDIEVRVFNADFFTSDTIKLIHKVESNYMANDDYFNRGEVNDPYVIIEGL